MTSETATSISVSTQILAFLSIVGFWLLPFSPFVSMLALARSERDRGWTRRLAVSGAVLCAVYTVALGSWILFVYFRLPVGA